MNCDGDVNEVGKTMRPYLRFSATASQCHGVVPRNIIRAMTNLPSDPPRVATRTWTFRDMWALHSYSHKRFKFVLRRMPRTTPSSAEEGEYIVSQRMVLT